MDTYLTCGGRPSEKQIREKLLQAQGNLSPKEAAAALESLKKLFDEDAVRNHPLTKTEPKQCQDRIIYWTTVS
jgi:hypothetical protein